MSYNFFVKSNIIFGRGAEEKLTGLIQGYGLKNVMVVYDQGVKAAGISDKIMERVRQSGAGIAVFDGVIPNPTNEIVEQAAAMAKEAKVDGFVAVGGGSSIDLAKAVNVLMTNDGTIGQYGGMNMVKNPCLPLIAIPTTAGTSSEITNVSALIDTEKVVKYVVIDNYIHHRMSLPIRNLQKQCRQGLLQRQAWMQLRTQWKAIFPIWQLR